MGRTGALGFAEQVDEGNVSLAAALSWHLGSNHFPAVPQAFVATCIAAIEAAQDEEWDKDIELPLGCNTCHTLLPFNTERTGGVTPTDPETGVAIVVLGEVVGHEGHDIIEDAITWRDDRDVASASALIESFHLDSFISIPDSGPDYPNDEE